MLQQPFLDESSNSESDNHWSCTWATKNIMLKLKSISEKNSGHREPEGIEIIGACPLTKSYHIRNYMRVQNRNGGIIHCAYNSRCHENQYNF